MISGIQHFAFCERQWALIHIEQQWQENVKTVEGRQIHERVDDPEFVESRGNTLLSRSVPIMSKTLGLYGIADLVEFHFYDDAQNGISIRGKKGRWRTFPIEYKRGEAKLDNWDEVQLCAQAICLEEMLNTFIHYGYIFYAQIRRRVKVEFTNALRNVVKELSAKMHEMFEAGITPKAKYRKQCKSCSMYDICMPKMTSKDKNVGHYIQSNLEVGG